MSSTVAPDDTICPRGYICDFVNESMVYPLRTYSCRALQKDVIDNGYGDILAGIYCPNATVDDGGANIKNCPSGHYCPDPFEDPIMCRAGYYCPSKSSREDAYHCNGCKEGSTSFAINTPVLVILVLFFVVIPVGIVKVLEFKKKKALESKKKQSATRPSLKKTTFKSVQRMKHILQMMDERLGDVFVNKTDNKGHIVGFSSDKLFDAIDENCDGTLSYEELDKAMALTGDQLAIFIQKMNESAGHPDNTTRVSRECFVRYFFKTIETASNYDPTPEDAEHIFYSIKGSDGNRAVLDTEHWYKSSLSTFLSDKQVLRLLRLFQNRSVDEEGGREDPQQASDSLMGSTPPLRQFSFNRVAKKLRAKESQRKSTFGIGQEYITKEAFVRLYPVLLHDLVDKVEEEKRHIFDIQFEKLSLTVYVKGNEKAVVNNVTGRIQSGTMTALMGGSGAGKTSLLNALCGRAHYGKVSGAMRVNGNLAKMEDCTSSMGFVPQDDIVHAELTVKENLIFAGKMKLPRGTSLEYISDLADDVIADLGLTRVANSMVGDVRRRGVSGGEKKRVNIGLELMSKPSILFLDEPTSGLDSASAMTVMGSLSTLVKNQGMTVCTVIHQPRKQIFEMFDSLLLLGVGGNMVYHGPATSAKDYFFNLGYSLGQGESLADWIIDISSGELSLSSKDLGGESKSVSAPVGGPQVNDTVTESKNYEANDNDNETEYSVPSDSNAVKPMNVANETDENESKPLLSVDAVGAQYPPAENRERLYKAWNAHFNGLKGEDKKIYMMLSRTVHLPPDGKSPVFFVQVWNQLQRCAILFQRNLPAKISETVLIVVGTIIIAVMSGPLKLTTDDMDPQIPSEYYVLTSVGADPGRFESGLPFLFRHATEEASKILGYGGKVSVIIAVLTTLSTAKVLADKRLEFFREAASGYNINAYFLAVVVFSTFEVTVKMIITSLFSFALRGSATNAGSTVLHFILLGWIASAWGFLFPLIVPRESIVLVAAFFTVFGCLLLSGFPGAVIEYSHIYGEFGLNAFIAGIFAPSRFFIESCAIGELRALEVQHGFTEYVLFADEDNHTTSKLVSVGFNSTSIGMHDPFVHEHSSRGWYWGILPAIFVGLTIRVAAFVLLQLRNRTQMLKPPITKESPQNKCRLILFFVLFAACFGISVFTFMHDPDDPFALCEVGEDFLNKWNLRDECNEEYNTKFCRFDNGDCDAINLLNEIKKLNQRKYPDCTRTDIYKVGDDYCHDHIDGLNTERCGWDGGDCLHPDYPECKGINPEDLNDNYCEDYGPYAHFLNTKECEYEGGDCDELNAEMWKTYPNCTGVHPNELNNGRCNGFANTEACGWDGGDCDEMNVKLWANYPDCKIGVRPNLISDSSCDSYPANSEECGWDGGDCVEFNKKYPGCDADIPSMVGNRACQLAYNTTECAYDGGDCVVEGYPNCEVSNYSNSSRVGDGNCEKVYNTPECGFDGGDCIEFNEKYPRCGAYRLDLVDNGVCDNDGGANTEECDFEGGDCIEFNEKYPRCDTYSPELMDNGVCDNSWDANTEECGFEGGDCIEFNKKYPLCEGDGNLVGNEVCDDGYGRTNNEECGFEGGDCIEFNEKYPLCKTFTPLSIGNGECDNSWDTNTEECGFEGGDCIEFNEKYPGCRAWNITKLGDGSCDSNNNANTTECKWDDGDCL